MPPTPFGWSLVIGAASRMVDNPFIESVPMGGYGRPVDGELLNRFSRALNTRQTVQSGCMASLNIC